jgi:hypothetical protein
MKISEIGYGQSGIEGFGQRDDRLCRVILSDALILPPELDAQVSFAPMTHHLLRFASARAYLQLHPVLRQFLAAANVRFILGSYYDETAVNGPQLTLSPDRKDNQRKHRNQSPGVYDKTAKVAYAFQYRLCNEREPLIGQCPDSASIAAGEWLMNSPRAVARVTRHEIWHAIDYNADLPSRRASFRKAYVADVTAQGGRMALREAGWGYFIQDDIPHRGACEVFAEVGAALNGGGVRGRRILRQFPQSSQFVAQFQRDLIAAHDVIPAPLPSLQRQNMGVALSSGANSNHLHIPFDNAARAYAN